MNKFIQNWKESNKNINLKQPKKPHQFGGFLLGILFTIIFIWILMFLFETEIMAPRLRDYILDLYD